MNHIAIVDFADFKDLIDALGGIDVDVPAPIISNKFDCPYATEQRCDAWQGWRFAKGEQHMNGQRALVYARIRENRLDPSESDVTRAERQQRVLQAISSRLTSPMTLAKLPFMGDDVAAPLATDLSAAQMVQLGWVKLRAPAGRALHCRLGGNGIERRRAVGDRAERGQPQRDRDGDGAVGAAAAGAGIRALRAGLRGRQRPASAPLRRRRADERPTPRRPSASCRSRRRRPRPRRRSRSRSSTTSPTTRSSDEPSRAPPFFDARP